MYVTICISDDHIKTSLRLYPELLRLGAGVGATACHYCQAVHAAELPRCPACGAPTRPAAPAAPSPRRA